MYGDSGVGSVEVFQSCRNRRLREHYRSLSEETEMPTFKFDVPFDIGSRVFYIDKEANNVIVVCGFCNGSGNIIGADKSTVLCPVCKGHGTKEEAVSRWVPVSQDEAWHVDGYIVRQEDEVVEIVAEIVDKSGDSYPEDICNLFPTASSASDEANKRNAVLESGDIDVES